MEEAKNNNQETYQTVAHKLRTEKKSNEEFEVMLANLTLEEIIALKLEISARAVMGKLFGFNLWQSIPNIAKESILMYVNSAAKSKAEAAMFLGMNKSNYLRLLRKFKITDSFKNKN